MHGSAWWRADADRGGDGVVRVGRCVFGYTHMHVIADVGVGL